MGVRPPTDDDTSPDVIEFGIAAVDARIDESDLSFPASRADVVDALGDERIAYDARGHDASPETVVQKTDRETFETKHELLNALHPVFQGYRDGTERSVVEQVRSLLPF